MGESYWGLSTEAWVVLSAIGTMIAAIAAAITVVISGWQVRAGGIAGREQLALDKARAEQQLELSQRAADVQLLRHQESLASQEAQAARVLLEQNRPYVVVSFQSSQPMMNWIELVISNVGTSPAYDVRFTTDKPMTRASHERAPLSESRIFTEGMRMLAPGAEVRAVFDDMTERCPAGLDMRFEIAVDYRNSQGDTWHEVMDLDLDDRHDLTFFEVFNTHHVAQALRDVRDTLKSWKAMKSGEFSAVVEGRDSNLQRRAEERDERLEAIARQREARQSSVDREES